MSSILLDHNNKLGDNMMFNAVVREYCKKYDEVGIFCMPKYYESVAFMYRDLKNLRIELAGSDAEKRNLLLLRKFGLRLKGYDKVKHIYADPEAGILVERQLYGVAGVPFEKKWSGFYVERDHAREEAFFERVVTERPYAFIHDDTIYGGLMDVRYFTQGLAEVRATPALSSNIFDYCKVIKDADEIHVVDSVFMFFVDCLAYSNPKQKLFVHRYARANAPWNMPVLKKNWTILQ